MFESITDWLKKNLWFAEWRWRPDIILALILLIAIVMIVLPLPVFMIDILIAINITFSIILLLVVIYIDDPLDLSVFPALLLITTLYRLSLTISTTRLVLLKHNAGNIVEGFGRFVVGSNLTVGLVIFFIITIVQFIVITKGTERVAEVSARFSLDGMPGKQMSIDGDLRTGVIDAFQAQKLRQLVQQESRFLGAMDGAMKFVKGDAIAGIIVVLVNIIGGIIIGIVQYGMTISEALQTYSILSIGDGLCGQIPSLLISLGAGIIVTRVPSEKRQNLAGEVFMQLSKQSQALMFAAVVLLLFSLVPGFPFIYFFILALLAALAYIPFLKRRSCSSGVDFTDTSHKNIKETAMRPGARPLMLRITPSLNTASLAEEIDALRWSLFENYGVPLPEIAIVIEPDKSISQMTLFLYQEPVFNQIIPEQPSFLIFGFDKDLDGEKIILPNGMGKITWLPIEMKSLARDRGFVAIEKKKSLCEFLRRVLIRYMAEFIGVQEARYLMDAMEGNYSELVKELQRQLSISKIAETLQRLVAEGVSIRDLRLIFGTLIEWAPREKDVLMLTEYVRIALRRHLIHRLKPIDKPLMIIRIGEGIENLIRESIRQTNIGAYTALSPEQNHRILTLIANTFESLSNEVCLVTSMDVRRFLRNIIEKFRYDIPVLSWQELGGECEVHILTILDLSAEELVNEHL